MNYNDGKWHGWGGGECPVHPETVVETKDLDGYEEEVNSGAVNWDHGFGCNDIVAFRVIKEHKEPREFWIVKAPNELPEVHCHNPNYHGDVEVIHVREVIE